MPLKDQKKVFFKNIHKMLYHPYVIYCDFECMLKQIPTIIPQRDKSFFLAIEEHVPYTYFIIVLDIHDKIIFKKYYQGENAIQNFLSVLKK